MPSLVSNIKHQDVSFEYVTPLGKWHWTTRLDVSRANPVYSVHSIISPFGLLRDSIPLPGELIKAMAESIDELRTSFAPSILLGPPTMLTFSVDEGRGFAPSEESTITNNGVFGSLLGCTLTPSAPWLRVTPANIGNLSLNETGTFSVEVDSATMVASASPYAAAVTIQDPSAGNSPIVLPVTVNVRPKATLQASTSLRVFSATKPLTGPYPSIAPQAFNITNVGPSGSVLEYEVQKLTGLSDWLVSFLPASGTLGSGQSGAVTVNVVPPQSMLRGTYSETLRISGFSSNSYVDVEIRLVIS